MEEIPVWVADACTLPTAEQPLRVAEFDQLFTDALRAIRRVSPTHLELKLDATAETMARDLTARETSCCSFFTFHLTPTGDGLVRMDIEVPAEHRDVLDGLGARALQFIQGAGSWTGGDPIATT